VLRDSALHRFTRDLTDDARAGRLDPVRCRDAEIDRVIDILLRYGKNNPALVGAAGVGKTAIVEGLAQRVVAGDVPLVLRDVRILSLDHVALLGGTTYRGQYESRITALIDEVTAATDVILFVDELHNLIGQGSAMGAAMDAGNMLKPALVRGEFRVIGATTSEEYDRWVCGDPALERRFQRVDVRELSAADTLDILRARTLRLERHHGVVIADDAIEAAVRLTDEYVPERARPDRAIDALDEACAHTQALARYTGPAAALLDDRRALLRGRAPRAAAEPAAAPADADALERFARTGFDALERFGAEIEAVFAGRFGDGTGGAARGATESRAGDRRDVPTSGATAGAGGSPATPPASGAAPGAAPGAASGAASGPRARSLGELDELLRIRLAEDGVVVRAHDVARAVAVATGRSVVWHSP